MQHDVAEHGVGDSGYCPSLASGCGFHVFDIRGRCQDVLETQAVTGQYFEN